ncbi:MAG: SpoIIE family protein phosphatase [Deltaproteobacteria bacterium]|nr:SpoIIE family protein phosphatase [Deltaproteobacteria bacterium]
MRSRNDPFERQALRCLHRMSRAIAAAPGLHAVCDHLLAEAVRVIPVTKASIMRYDSADRALRIVAARGLAPRIARTARVRVGEGISGKVFASSRPLLVQDIRRMKGVRGRARYRGRSFIAAPMTCVPLTHGRVPVGVMNMADKRDGTPFTARDLELLTTIANHVASYLHLCNLAERVEAARHVERELEIARGIQQGLFPSRRPRMRGCAVAGACWPAARVGGDYYDVFAGRGEGPASVVVADVAGHNIGAALTMAGVRSILRAEISQPLLSAAAIATRLNALLFPDLVRAEQFVSMAIAQYHAADRSLRFCIAGHPPPLLYCAAHKTVSPLAGSDGLLGIESAAGFREHRMQLHRGDVLVIYTDGLVQAKNARGTPFGLARLRRCMARRPRASATGLLGAIARAVRAHCGGRPWLDDVTCLILKVTA